MSRTYRTYGDWMNPYEAHSKSLRRPRTTNERRAQAMLNELVRDRSLELDFPLNLGNRPLVRHIPHAHDDYYISGLDDVKYLWRDSGAA